MQDNMNSSDTDTSTSVSSSDNGHQFVQHLCMIYQSKVRNSHFKLVKGNDVFKLTIFIIDVTNKKVYILSFPH